MQEKNNAYPSLHNFKIFTLIPIVPEKQHEIENFLEDILKNKDIFENKTISAISHKFKIFAEITQPNILSEIDFEENICKKLEIGVIFEPNQIPVLIVKANLECTFDQLPGAAAFFYDPENKYLVNGKNILEFFQDEKFLSYRLSLSRHQIVFSSIAIPENLIQNVLMKGNHNFKEGNIEVHQVKELASLRETQVLVWDTNTLTWGWEKHSIGDRRIQEILLNAAATTAGETALKEIRMQTIRLIDEVSKASDIDRQMSNSKELWHAIRVYEQKLSKLRLQLAVAAEWPRSSDMVIGGKPLESYSKVLYSEIEFDNALDITTKMHDKIAQIISNIRTSLESIILIENNYKQQDIAESTRKLLYKTDSVQAIGLIATAIITIVSVTTLFATLAAIPEEGLLRPAVKNISTAGLIVVFAALLGYALHLTRKLVRKPSRYFKFLILSSSFFAMLFFVLSFFLTESKVILLLDSLALMLILVVVFTSARYTNDSE